MITAAITLSGTKRSRKRISQPASPRMALNIPRPPFPPTTLRSASRMVASRFTMRANCTGTGTFSSIITTTSTTKALIAPATTLPFGHQDLRIHHNSIAPSKSTPLSFLPLSPNQAQHPSKHHQHLRIWQAREGRSLLLKLRCPQGRLVRQGPFSHSNRSRIITIPMPITPWQ